MSGCPSNPRSRFAALAAANVRRPLLVDAVEKRFCSSERARLIQDQAPMRNVDSKIRSPRFDRCVFLFYSLSAATFSTASVKSGKARTAQLLSGLPSIADIQRCRPHACLLPLAAVSRCGELSYETWQWLIRGLQPNSKTAWGHLHTAHDAPLKMPDRSRAEPLHLRAARAQEAAAARTRDDRPARGGRAEA